MNIRILLGILFFLIVGNTSPSFVHLSVASGVSVTPAVLRIDLTKDSDVAEIIYTNHSKESVALQLNVQNFTTLEDGWTVQFIDNPTAQNFRYSLSSWITFDTTSVVLEPGESKTVKIYIDKKGLPPGGHYASIQATLESSQSTGTLGIQGALSSILFVRGSSGEEVESGTIQNTVLHKRWYTFPETMQLTFNNTGNVETVPYGECRIISMRGTLVAKAIMNEDSLITLPETVRTYTLLIRKVVSTIFPGRYTVECNIHLGDQESASTYSQQFFSLGTFSRAELIYAILFMGIGALLLVRMLRR